MKRIYYLPLSCIFIFVLSSASSFGQENVRLKPIKAEKVDSQVEPSAKKVTDSDQAKVKVATRSGVVQNQAPPKAELAGANSKLKNAQSVDLADQKNGSKNQNNEVTAEDWEEIRSNKAEWIKNNPEKYKSMVQKPDHYKITQEQFDKLPAHRKKYIVDNPQKYSVTE